MAAHGQLREDVRRHLKQFTDFPKPGINFHDVLPLMAQPALLERLSQHVADQWRGQVDAIAGLEARGFLFGPAIALKLNIPFIPVRKEGKLPGPTVRASYTKEYGTDTIEIQKNVLKAGHRVLLIDDLLATGGTLKAATDLIAKANAVCAGAFVLIELCDLKGRTVVGNHHIDALLTY